MWLSVGPQVLWRTRLVNRGGGGVSVVMACSVDDDETYYAGQK